MWVEAFELPKIAKVNDFVWFIVKKELLVLGGLTESEPSVFSCLLHDPDQGQELKSMSMQGHNKINAVA